MLRITPEQFKLIYKDTSLVDAGHTFYSAPDDSSDMYTNYVPSKLWRLNNLYTIVDKQGERIRFCMNRAQHKVYAASLRHSRVIILKSRQQGISTLWLVSFFDDLITNRDFSIGLMAQGKDEASTLLERTKILWEELPNEFKRYMNVVIDVDNTEKFKLTNGSSIFIRTSFRSATLQRLHVSEMGKIANKSPQKAKETKTGTLQALAPGNTGIIESTAEGNNMFKTMWDTAISFTGTITPKDFIAVFLSWLDDPDCTVQEYQEANDMQHKYFLDLERDLNITLTQQQKNFWITQYRELGEEIHQEYPSTAIEAFMATKDGAYYARLYMEHVVKGKKELPNLYDPNLEVQVAVDLGMNDTNVLIVFQKYVNEFRIIDEIYDNGEQISYYTDILKNKPYFDNVSHVILPHDANVRELTSGKTREEVFNEELPNVYVDILPKTSRIEGINMVRRIIHQVWLDPKCEFIKSCFLNYTKEWSEKTSTWKDSHVHDDYSNGADSIRYMVVGSEDYIPQQRRKKEDHSYDV